MVLIPTFRLPTQIHTRGGNAKWLNELANTNPVWINPIDAKRLGSLRTGDLVRLTTEIGYFVAKAWVTEGIRPGVVACSHHMGRWRLNDDGPGQVAATVNLHNDDGAWAMARTKGVGPTCIGGSGYAAHLVERCWRPSEPDVSGPSGIRSPACIAGIRRSWSSGPTRVTHTATSTRTRKRRISFFKSGLR